MKLPEKSKLVFAALFILAAVLRIYDIETKNPWFDEIYSWKISCGSIPQIVSETAGDIHPPFFYIVLKFWNFIFGDTLFSMRMLSVVLGLLAMYSLFELSRFILKEDLPVFFVLLLYAISPLNVFYSQEVRMLNLNLFLSLTAIYCMLKYLSRPHANYGILYCLFSVLSMYTHYFGLFVFGAGVIYSLMLFYKNKDRRKEMSHFFKYPAFAFGLFIPWFPLMAGQALSGQPWRSSQSIAQVADSVFVYFKDAFLSPYFSYESMSILYMSHALSLGIILFLLLCLLRIINSRSYFEIAEFPVIILFFLPLAMAIVVSFRQSIILSRYLSILLPYLLIILVAFSFRFYSRKTAVSICVAIAAFSVIGLKVNYGNQFKNNDYRKIISYIEERFEPDDMIIVEPHFMGWVINYEVEQSKTNISKPSVLGWDFNMQIDSLSKSDHDGRIWFISDYSSLSNHEYDSLNGRMHNLGYSRIAEKTFYPVPAKVNVSLFSNRKRK